MQRVILILCLLSTLGIAINGFSGETKYLGDFSIKDFENGKFVNVSLNQNGTLSLSPNIVEVFKKEDILFVWCVLKDVSGNIYFGTGNKARVYRLSKDGKLDLIYQHENATSISSLTIDSNGNLYAALSPESTIIKIKNDGTASVFTTFKEKYIWKLINDSNNNIYVATGNSASIYKLSSDASKTLLYTTNEESHFLTLKTDQENNIYFASEGKGIVYKFNMQTQKVKILYDCYENEIKDILIDSHSNVYFATATKKAIYPPKNSFNYTDTFILYGSRKDTVPTSTSKKAPMKNSIYKITKDGIVEKLFTRDNTIFLSLAMDKQENLYAGSGDEGIIYKIKGVNKVSIFLETKELQVLSLEINDENQLIASTGNVGKVFKVGFSSSNTGNYLSQVFSVGGKAVWGKIIWKSEDIPNTKINLFTRSGNTNSPDTTWSDWSKEYIKKTGESITSPSAQYIQYKAVLSSDSNNSPALTRVVLFFVLENRPPNVENIRLVKEPDKRLNVIDPFSNSLPPSVYSLSWESFDMDMDFLMYTVYFQEEKSPNWILLEKDIPEKRFSFDSRRFSDGNYRFKVVASDEKSNDKTRFKTGFNVSTTFKIDNTPPKIINVTIQKIGELYKISGTASDRFSMIKVIQYSINSTNWVYMGPTDMIYDSKDENFEVIINPINNPNILKGKNVIIFKIADYFNNFTTHEVVFNVD